jgi:hypothetical protein
MHSPVKKVSAQRVHSAVSIILFLEIILGNNSKQKQEKINVPSSNDCLKETGKKPRCSKILSANWEFGSHDHCQAGLQGQELKRNHHDMKSLEFGVYYFFIL